MKCQNCGCEMPNDVQFCTSCGANVGVVPTTKMSKAKKAKLILIIAAALIGVIAITCTVVFFTSPAYSVCKSMKSEKYVEAFSTYTAKVEGRFVQEWILRSTLNGYHDTVTEKFQSKELEYDSAIDALKALNNMGFLDASDSINEVNNAQADEIVKQFNNNDMDFDSAVAAFTHLEECGYTSTTKKIQELAETEANKIVESFKNKEVDFPSALLDLEHLETLGYKNAADKVLAITTINDATVALEKGDQYYENGDYEKAIDEYNKISTTDDNYDTAQSRLNQLYPEYVQSVANTASAYYSSRRYEDAIRYVNTALNILPESIETAELDKIVEGSLKAYKTHVLNKVTELINTSQFSEAFALINEAMLVDDNDEFRKAQSTTEAKYVESISATVQEHLDNEDYVSAKRVVSNALTVLPNNTSLISLQTMVETNTPTYLVDVCEPYSSYWYDPYVNGEQFIMGGKAYSYGFVLGTSPFTSGYALFNIEGKYQTLSFYVGHTDESAMSDTDLKIYCDGILKAQYTIDCEALPQKFTVDLTGVKQLKIEACNASSFNVRYGFGNVIVK